MKIVRQQDMSMQDPESLMYQILRLKEEIDDVASKLNEINGVFGATTLRITNFVPSELGFLRTVSWLYAMYYEVGKVNVNFLTERFSAYNLDSDEKLAKHLRIVQQLRTFLQHDLNPQESRNLVIQEACEQWLKDQCETPIPGDDQQWKICLTSLLNNAIDFFSALRTCIRSVEQDDSRKQILNEWDFIRKRYHPSHEFDNLISKVATDMGRENLDVVRLRKRFYTEWVKELDLLRGNYDFEVEAQKLIEHALLQKMTPVLPITGHDIINEFNVMPGPKVGQLLEKARNLYNIEPCSRDELLEKLRLEIDTKI
jgi:hypothetical protein